MVELNCPMSNILYRWKIDIYSGKTHIYIMQALMHFHIKVITQL
jgi:hypothetical protein